MRKALATMCTFLLVVLSADAKSPLPAVSLDAIQRVESSVKMPPGAKPIANYNRFYTTEIRGRQMILGAFLLDSPGPHGTPPAVHIVVPQDMPTVFDGGCAVVHLQYDIRAARIVTIFCNGLP
jgi:hypothetical protein